MEHWFTHIISDICLLLEKFVVVSHLTIFPLELLGLAEKPMAGLSSSKGKIMRWDTFQISGSKHKCLLLPVLIQYLTANKGMKKFCHLETIIVFYSKLSFHLSHIIIERKTYAQTLADFHISRFFKSLRLLSTTGINLNNTNIFSVSYF